MGNCNAFFPKRAMIHRERNIGWGVLYGLLFATLYSAAAVLIYLFRGSEPFEANEVTLGSTVAVYFLGGILGGAIIGLLLPWTRWRIGSVIAGLPGCLGFGLLVSGPITKWDAAARFA